MSQATMRALALLHSRHHGPRLLLPPSSRLLCSIKKDTRPPPNPLSSYPPPPPGSAKSHVVKDEAGAKEEMERQREKRAQKLKEEMRRGYFYEVGQIKKTNCKLFEADKEVLPVASSPLFPSFEAESLLGVAHQFDTLLRGKNQVCLVAVSFRDFGFQMLPSWIKPFQEEFGNMPAVKVFQVALEDKGWMRVLKFLMMNGQKSQIEPDRHGQSFIRFGPTEAIREGLGIDNRMVGYVFLVDPKGRVRWRGTGDATEVEVGHMLKCCHELIEDTRPPDNRKRFAKVVPRRRGPMVPTETAE